MTLDTSAATYWPSWYGLSLMVGADQSTHIISTDVGEDRIRYAECRSACDQHASWVTLTVDSGGLGGVSSPTSGAVIAPDGIHAVWETGDTNYSTATFVRYVSCTTSCGVAKNWQSSTLFPGEIGNGLPFHGNPLAVDAKGGLHLLGDSLNGVPGLSYAYCAGACGTPTSWTLVVIDSTVTYPKGQTIVADAKGGVRVFYNSGHAAYDGMRYAGCDSSCTVPANWQSVTLGGSYGGPEASAAVVRPDGTIDLVFLDARGVNYASCAASCTSAASWGVVQVGAASGDASLARDRDGVLHLVFEASPSYTELTCVQGCLKGESWSFTTIKGPHLGGFLAIAVDSTGFIRLATTSAALQYSAETQ